mmetsp:Transcript_2395/g.9385  ORF Transcript_2395/g.9385 Transcript_2395/m.9385 type:complete len:209 (-) Transcript_2395:605-1231(-)
MDERHGGAASVPRRVERRTTRRDADAALSRAPRCRWVRVSSSCVRDGARIVAASLRERGREWVEQSQRRDGQHEHTRTSKRIRRSGSRARFTQRSTERQAQGYRGRRRRRRRRERRRVQRRRTEFGTARRSDLARDRCREELANLFRRRCGVAWDQIERRRCVRRVCAAMGSRRRSDARRHSRRSRRDEGYEYRHLARVRATIRRYRG